MESTIKSEIRSPDKKGTARTGFSAGDVEDGPDSSEPVKMKSQIVKVNSSSTVNLTGSNQANEGETERTKKLKVVRKVGVKQPGTKEPVVNRRSKERKTLEIYKPPGKSKGSFYCID